MNTFQNIFTEAIHNFKEWENQLIAYSSLQNARELLIQFEKIEPNSENYIVGGAVRDLLLGHEPHDIDIATNIDIKKLEKYFKSNDIGKSKDFGIITIQYKGDNFEVANFRQEEGYSDFRRPDKVTAIKSFEGDAMRRDFTINALGLDKNGQIHDYVNGVSDLNQQILRAVGNPWQRFTEDALRLLRTLRFSVKLGFQIESETEKAIVDLKDNIKKIAPERITEELRKVAGLGGKQLANYIEYLNKVGLLSIVLPEIKNLEGLEHSQIHHPEAPDVLGHVLAALKTSNSKDYIVNLSILFHDLGKAITQTKDDTGVHYHGHEDKSVEVIETLANRLKFSNEEKLAMQFAAEYHMHGHKFPELKTSKLLNIRQNPNWPILQQTIKADKQARGDKYDQQRYEDDMKYVDNIFTKFGEKQAFEKKMSAFVDGRLIMGLVPKIKGTDIGKIKDATREMIISKDFNVDKNEVINFIQQQAKELGYGNL